MTVAPDPHLLDSRLRRLVPVDQPLLLITQAQRSGGTLLLRLLDGHPECHVAPFQLRGIDEAAKRSSSRPELAWQELYDPKLAERFARGHRQRKHDILRDDEIFPFELDPPLQRAIYDTCTGRVGDPTSRDCFDCYFTSYFNAWLDYRNLRTGSKRWVVGFEPGVARSMRRRRAVRSVYPDGKMVTIVRDPWSWFASARRWEGRWADREGALNHWCDVGKGTFKLRKRYKADLRILTFDDLLANTEETLSRLVAWLGIEFRAELLQPTFNGSPIRANTSFDDVGTAVSTRPLERGRDELTDEDAAYIQERAGDIYRVLANKARKDWDAAPGGRAGSAG
jgi:Sulfotransferase family